MVSGRGAWGVLEVGGGIPIPGNDSQKSSEMTNSCPNKNDRTRKGNNDARKLRRKEVGPAERNRVAAAANRLPGCIHPHPSLLARSIHTSQCLPTPSLPLHPIPLAYVQAVNDAAVLFAVATWAAGGIK